MKKNLFYLTKDIVIDEDTVCEGDVIYELETKSEDFTVEVKVVAMSGKRLDPKTHRVIDEHYCYKYVLEMLINSENEEVEDVEENYEEMTDIEKELEANGELTPAQKDELLDNLKKEFKDDKIKLFI